MLDPSIAVRAICSRCRRPQPLCYCAHLPALDTRARIVFLQHPRERRVPIGTARMAQLSLSNSELHTGVKFQDNARVESLRCAPGAALLFPGEGAIDPEQLDPNELHTLFVIDGTWSQARKVLKLNPELLKLPRVGLRPEKPGNYRIRKEPSAECLATIEAVAGVLGVLERAPAKFESMLNAFTFMVDQQLAHIARGHLPRGKRQRARGPTEEERLIERRGDLVFVHAEVNAQARGKGTPGQPELLHLVARRSSGESFAAILAPRRPLSPSAANHLGLTESQILCGESFEPVQARWSEFIRPTDLHIGWGHFTRDQLVTEGIASPAYIDLRLVIARRLQSRPGAPDEAIMKLGGIASKTAAADRGSRVVAALEQAVSVLAHLDEKAL